MSGLLGRASALGANPVNDSSVDLTPFMLMPLDPGADNRGYVSTEARRGMERAMEGGKRKAKSLGEANLPPVVSAMLSADETKRNGYMWVSNRTRSDNFRSGEDHTLTMNTGKPAIEKRTADYTPPPRSPNPYNTDEAIMPGLRYEQSHQGAYRLTRAPGTTVFAPTQANQVADSVHERHASDSIGGWVYRNDTYHGTRMISAKPLENGEVEIFDSFYRRRKEKKPEPKNDNADKS